MKKILIIGSNFGAKAYLKSVKILYKKASIDIVSPNINKKKISYKYLKKFNNYKNLLNENYNMVICATKPRVQSDFINNYLKKKNVQSRIMVEKPLSNNFLQIFKTLRLIEKKKIIFNMNFIFPKINIWKKFFLLIKRNRLKIVNYSWHFKQEYFNNKIKTWKTNKNEGGGILLYYLPHVIFNLLRIDKNLKFKKITQKKNTKSLLTELRLLLFSNKNLISVDININSKKNCHIINARNKNKIIKLSNFTKDWTKNFKINNKTYLNYSSNEDRVMLTSRNLQELLRFNAKKNEFKNFSILTDKTYKILYQIKKKVDA
tara:strand:- start:3138 stop:4088 length:951 start_codon:yes stop_codon:yes gene_type:complete